jgi:exonuclease III
LKISSWNINGWTEQNKHLRQYLISNVKSDIFCLLETHLNKDDNIVCEGYTCFLNNRKVKNKKAPKASGGVAILVKEKLFDVFRVKVVDNEIDGILGIEFVHKLNEFSFVIFACYLSPDNSVWGRDPTTYFAHLMSQLYFHSDADAIFICGDLNGRIGNSLDYVTDIDDISVRENIDNVKSGHGDAILEFVKDGKLAVVNGRIDPHNDNFTFVSPRGKSVVDYFITPHDCLTYCDAFQVDLTSDLINKMSAVSMLSDVCKAPDHSLLTLTIRFTQYTETLQSDASHVHGENVITQSKRSDRKIYFFDQRPDGFLVSNIWRSAVADIIDRLLYVQIKQAELDDIYADICKNIFKELDNQLQYKCADTKMKKHRKISKPYWNEELDSLWKNANRCQKLYLKYKGNSNEMKNKLRLTFKNAQTLFDKTLKRTARIYNRSLLNKIETLSVNNPKAFWDHLRKLGPRKDSAIPVKVVIDNEMVTDEERVMNKWEQDFSSLYNTTNQNINFDDNFLKDIINEKNNLERNIMNDDYLGNALLNRNISLDEIEKVVNRLKTKKATGVDYIPNEVLKSTSVSLLLYNLFTACFKTGIIPSVWSKALIKPIPKCSSKDPYVPLNYRGISR